jgi:flagellum-specific peptidoglycan hydrolase FlgJ
MSSVFWPKSDVDTMAADAAKRDIEEQMASFELRQQERELAQQQPAQPAMAWDFSSLRSTLMPWDASAQSQNTSATAPPVAAQADPWDFSGLRASLNPWAPPPTPSGTPVGMPTNAPRTGAIESSAITQGEAGPLLQPGESVGSVTMGSPPPVQQTTLSAPTPAGGEIDNSSRESFVRTAWPYMLEAAGGNRDAAEMMLATAISENGSIGSGRPIWANNMFGIKGRGDAGSANAATHEIVNGQRQDINDDFAAYSSPAVGSRAFFDFLRANSRYAPALQRYQQTGDASQLFRDVNAAGYATDPDWASKVENIRRNQVAPVIRQVAGDPRQSLNAGQGQSLPAPAAPPAGAGAIPPASAPAPDTAWSPDSLADGSPIAFQSAAGRSGGPGVMYRGPLGASPAEVGNEGAPSSSYQDPDTLSYPVPLPPQQPTYQDPDTLTYPPTNTGINPQIQDGRTAPPTPQGDWREVQTVAPGGSGFPASSERPNQEPAGQFLAEDSQSQAPAIDQGYGPRRLAPDEPSIPARAAAAVTSAASAYADASAVPVDQRPPLYTGASYAPPSLTQDEPSPYGQVQASPGEPDYVNSSPRTWDEQVSRGVRDASLPGGILEPTGGATRQIARMQRIQWMATIETGLNPFAAVDDPAWRAANPALAAEYDELQVEFGINVATNMDAPRLGNAGRRMAPDAAAVPNIIERGREWLNAGRRVAPEAAEATIGHGGAPMERPPVWTTKSTADDFDPQWAEPGFLERAGIPTAAPRRPKPDDYLYHLTPVDRVGLVAQEGLQPRTSELRGEQRMLPRGEMIPRVRAIYAADNAPILSTVDRDVLESTEWALVRFRHGSRGWRKDPEFAANQGAWMTRRPIPATEIEVFDGQVWRPASEIAPRGEPPAAPRTAAPDDFTAAASRGVIHESPTGAPAWSLPEGVTEVKTPISAGLSSGYSPDDIKAFYLNRRWKPEWDADPSLMPPSREGFPPYTREVAAKHAQQEFVRDLRREPPAVRALIEGHPSAPSGEMLLGSGMVPEQSRRFYHGTAGAFERPDPGKFDENGLFGPGYYLTSDPRVAGSYAEARTPVKVSQFEDLTEEAQYLRDIVEGRDARWSNDPKQRAFAERRLPEVEKELAALDISDVAGGPNIRAVDVPSGLRMLDIDGPTTAFDSYRMVSKAAKATGDPRLQEVADHIWRVGRDAERSGLYNTWQDAFDEIGAALDDPAAANRAIAAAGYDGITHRGGQRVPMLDDAGQPIEHDVTIIFPESLNKIRNAFSGEQGGSGFVPRLSDAQNAAQGGVIGAASEIANDEDLTPTERLARIAGGAALGVAAGRSARGRRLPPGTQRRGSGFIPHPDPAMDMRTRVIPPHVVDTLTDFPIRVPTDPGTIRAIEAVGGTIDPQRGVTLNVIRNEDEAAHGGTATRGAVFYIAGKPGTPNPYERTHGAPSGTGGTDRIEDRTRFRSPLIVSGAPGDHRGFNEAMEQFTKPRIEEAQAAFDEAAQAYREVVGRHGGNLDELRATRDALEGPGETFEAYSRSGDLLFTGESRAEVRDWAVRNGSPTVDIVRAAPPRNDAWLTADRALQDVFQARHRVSEAQRALQAAKRPVTAESVDEAIRAVAASSKRGTPEYAQGIKDLVTKYGGDPEIVDDMLAVRGADAGERFYAIRENIVSAHARKNKYDGVVTVVTSPANPTDIAKHPAVVAAREAWDVEESKVAQAITRGDYQEIDAARASAARANDAYIQARAAAKEEFSTSEISELADPREARNPTPGVARDVSVVDTSRQLDEARKEWRRLAGDLQAGRGDPQALDAAMARVSALEADYDYVLTHGTTRIPGESGYTLRDDVKPAAMRAREAADAARAEGQTDAAFNDPAVQAAGQRALAADAALKEARASGDAAAIEAARAERTAAYAEHARLQNEAHRALNDDPRFRTPASAVMPFDPTAAAAGAGAGAELDEDGNPVGFDPMRAGLGMAAGAVVGRKGVTAKTLKETAPAALNWYQRTAAQNARRIARSDKEPLSPRQWLMSLAGNVGYSSMLGPGTFSVNMATGGGEALWSIPKEGVRGAVRAGQTRNLSALREQGEMQLGAMYGMSQVGTAILDVLKGQGKYAPNPNFPTLSQQTVNPIGQLIAQATEAPGRVWSGLPDAIFGTIAHHAGEAREAAQIATSKGLKGAEWKAEMNRLLTEARAVAKGELPTGPEVQQAVDAGEKYAKRQTYRDELGRVGEFGEKIAKLGNAPVIGTWATPFYKTIWTAGVRQAEKTPFGLGMNSQPTKLDRRYDALVGGAVVLGLAEYARRGNVTGSGPSDPKERELLREQGWQPYSTYVKLPGMEGRYVPNRMFNLFEGTLNAAGEVHDAFAYQKPDADARAKFDGAIRRTGQLIRQNPYAFQGIVSILDAYNEGPIAAAAGEAARMTPLGATMRTIGMAGDTQERTTDRGKGVDPADEFMQRWQLSTGQRSGLPVAQDAFGQPRANQRPGLAALLPNVPREKAAPIADLFREARVMPGAPRPEIRLDDDPDMPPIPLKPQERRLWDQERGKALLVVGEKLAAHPKWKDAPLETKQEILKEWMREAADTADEQVKASIGADELRRRIRSAAEMKRKAS